MLAAGGDPRKIVFSGVGKTRDEMRTRAGSRHPLLQRRIRQRAGALNDVAGELGHAAPVSLRVNPDVDAKTHPYISTGLKDNKFGIAIDDAAGAVSTRQRDLPHLEVDGIDCHIGSQLLDPAPAAEAADKVLALVDALAADGIALAHIDLGGGMGIRYRDEIRADAGDYLAPLLQRARRDAARSLLFEPGRSLVGNAGLLLTRVEVLKHGEEKNFAVVDAAMNDLMRPALYDAWHDIVPVNEVGARRTRREATLRNRRPDLRNRRLPRPRPRTRPRPKAICSPSFPPAPTAWP